MKSFLALLFQVLSGLERSMKQFNTNYMVLKDYLDDASKRLQALSASASEVSSVL